MRRAIPNPCKEPSAWRVFRIMRSSVPCKTSDFSPLTVTPLDTAKKITALLCNVHRKDGTAKRVWQIVFGWGLHAACSLAARSHVLNCCQIAKSLIEVSLENGIPG